MKSFVSPVKHHFLNTLFQSSLRHHLANFFCPFIFRTFNSRFPFISCMSQSFPCFIVYYLGINVLICPFHAQPGPIRNRSDFTSDSIYSLLSCTNPFHNYLAAFPAFLLTNSPAYL